MSHLYGKWESMSSNFILINLSESLKFGLGASFSTVSVISGCNWMTFRKSACNWLMSKTSMTLSKGKASPRILGVFTFLCLDEATAVGEDDEVFVLDDPDPATEELLLLDEGLCILEKSSSRVFLFLVYANLLGVVDFGSRDLSPQVNPVEIMCACLVVMMCCLLPVRSLGFLCFERVSVKERICKSNMLSTRSILLSLIFRNNIFFLSFLLYTFSFVF